LSLGLIVAADGKPDGAVAVLRPLGPAIVEFVPSGRSNMAEEDNADG
jgi:hypothetical protein